MLRQAPGSIPAGVITVGVPDVLDVVLSVFAPGGVPPVGAGQFGAVEQGRRAWQEDLYQVVGEAEVAGERDGQAEEEPRDPGDQDGGSVGEQYVLEPSGPAGQGDRGASPRQRLVR